MMKYLILSGVPACHRKIYPNCTVTHVWTKLIYKVDVLPLRWSVFEVRRCRASRHSYPRHRSGTTETKISKNSFWNHPPLLFKSRAAARPPRRATDTFLRFRALFEFRIVFHLFLFFLRFGDLDVFVPVSTCTSEFLVIYFGAEICLKKTKVSLEISSFCLQSHKLLS